jgi:plastocyanin
MSDETIFYILGGILAASAVIFTFAGLKLNNFPGKALPVVILWFAVLACGAATYSVLQAKEHEEAHAAEHHEAEDAEEAESGPYENEGGALGGERDELEEEAEKEAEGSPEEEPVGPSEKSEEGGGSTEELEGSGAGASATTLQLAADPTQIAFDKTELSAEAGKVTIDFDNPAALPHNVVIEKEGEQIAGTPEITEDKASVSAELEAGSYEFVCTVPGHEEAGMKGTLTVE